MTIQATTNGVNDALSQDQEAQAHLDATTPPKAKKPVKLALTSRAKMGAARKARPAKKVTAKKAAPKVDTAAAEKALRTGKAQRVAGSIELRKEPGTGWFHIDREGSEIGIAFKTSIKGKVCWRAQSGMDRIKKGEERPNAFGSTAAEAAEAFARQIS